MFVVFTQRLGTLVWTACAWNNCATCRLRTTLLTLFVLGRGATASNSPAFQLQLVPLVSFGWKTSLAKETVSTYPLVGHGFTKIEQYGAKLISSFGDVGCDIGAMATLCK